MMVDRTPVHDLQDLHFEDVAGGICMDISRDVEDTKCPLEISISGFEEDQIQTYTMNENELFALFNLLTDILKSTYEKRIEELRHKAGVYNSLQEDER